MEVRASRQNHDEISSAERVSSLVPWTFLRLLKEHPAALFGFFFAILFLGNIGTLTNPPYWDELLGLHNQAVFLAKNHFSFTALWRPEQAGFNGSCVYPLGVMPVIYGVMYYFLPPTVVHFTGHMLNIALLAGCATLLCRLTDGRFTMPVALLWSLAFLAEPLVFGRSAAQDQDATLAFTVMLGLFYALRGRFAASRLWAFAGCLIKLTGIILPLAFAAADFYALLRERTRAAAVRFGVSSVCVLLGWLLAALPARLLGGMSGSLGWRFSTTEIVFHLRHYYPYLAIAATAALVFFAVDFIRSRETRLNYALIATALFVAGYFLAYFIAPFPRLPRYTVIAVMPIALLAALCWPRRLEKAAAPILVAMLALHVLNWQGLLMPRYRVGLGPMSYLERNREYLSGVASDRSFIAELEKSGPRRIVCRWPYAAMLTMPEFGYVKSPMTNVQIADTPPLYAPVSRLNSVKEADPDTLWIYSPRNLPLAGSDPYLCLPRNTSILEYIENPASPENGIVAFSNCPPRR